MRNKKIFFVHQGQRSFFDADAQILKEIGELRRLDHYPPTLSKWPAIFKNIIWCDLVYIWFMGRHAVLPLLLAKLLGKKIVLVAGGWDVANCPEINYGLMRPSLFWPFLQWLFRLPNIVLAVSKANQRETVNNARVPAEKIRLIYHGFQEVPPSTRAKEKMVVTIGEINKSNLERKGLEKFVRTAALLPDIPFILIGRWAEDGSIDRLKKIATPNVIFTGLISEENKNDYLSRALAYAQFSYHEAFGCAVAEAMLHQCVPVVTDRYALPEVVGNTGYIIRDNPEDIKQQILTAFKNPSLGVEARQRIVSEFPFEKRAKLIQDLIHKLLK